MENKYYHSKESVEEYITSAVGFNGSELIEKLALYLQSGSQLLELGSGPGSDWELLNKDYSCLGSDFSNEFLKVLKEKYPSGEFIELDAVKILTERMFDGIYSNKVLHHLSDGDLTESIHRQFQVLNTGGIICHSFWKGEGSEEFKGMFVNYHSKSDLKESFGKHFQILLLEDYAEFEADDSLLLIAKKL